MSAIDQMRDNLKTMTGFTGLNAGQLAVVEQARRALMSGKSAFESAKIAADYTVLCIENTQDDPDHWYGVKFEPVLGDLIGMLK